MNLLLHYWFARRTNYLSRCIWRLRVRLPVKDLSGWGLWTWSRPKDVPVPIYLPRKAWGDRGGVAVLAGFVCIQTADNKEAWPMAQRNHWRCPCCQTERWIREVCLRTSHMADCVAHMLCSFLSFCLLFSSSTRNKVLTACWCFLYLCLFCLRPR